MKDGFRGPDESYGQNKKETIEVPLLITKAQTAPLMGLNWMQWLKMRLSANNDAIQIHNINLDNPEKRIIKIQNDFKDLLYDNKEMKNFC